VKHTEVVTVVLSGATVSYRHQPVYIKYLNIFNSGLWPRSIYINSIKTFNCIFVKK